MQRTLLSLHQKSGEPSLLKMIDSFALLTWAGLTDLRTLLQWLLGFLIDSEDWFCWYKTKEWFVWAIVAAQAAENHGDEWGLTWYLQWEIDTSTPNWVCL